MEKGRQEHECINKGSDQLVDMTEEMMKEKEQKEAAQSERKGAYSHEEQEVII